ncbi:mandelate racemase/muconate lactonizing enzyme family protein [Pseudooceanicola sp. GBMRC 2024]|uniref:Mandelate racemase/muconate lactonizing enzyme family protein n=1 Tax=Pseudooceanicola albus TaxID=2692189 RepID=A0A6L7G3I4_9RHOB|nr:mandelate racemase/muconate lactonizing enzyme family protein [Pseudooceanicola albus]MXN17930.1 mandelate racemase/muconate lactonizing enzyme family protein [Pseudooceanicola albus]
MKISAIEPVLFNAHPGRNLLLVRVETDAGIEGWGECYVIPRQEGLVTAYITRIAAILSGRSPFHSRHHWQILSDDFGIRRPNLHLACAWSGIEIALWDIVGKAAGLPVHRLLGGAVRDRIRVYANGWGDGIADLDDLRRRAEAVLERGFTAMKWDPYQGPWRTIIDRAQEDRAVANVAAVRDAVGPDVDLLIDAHRRVAPHLSASFARRVEEFGILQLEDPNPADNLASVAETRARTTIPIVTGETLHTKEQFDQVFRHRAADIINPDVGIVGGISGMLDIATLAEPHAVGLSPHSNLTTTVGLAATTQVSALVRNFVIAEYFVSLEESSRAVAPVAPEVSGGWVQLPDSPGLGVEVDREALAQRPPQDIPPAQLRQYWEE